MNGNTSIGFDGYGGGGGDGGSVGLAQEEQKEGAMALLMLRWASQGG